MPLLRPSMRSLATLSTATTLAAVVACSTDSGTNPNPDTTPAAISVVSGSGQTTQAGTALPGALVAKVVNAAGDPLSGVVVAWTVEAGGGSLASATSTTNQSGAASDTYTTGATAGANTVRATVQATALSTTFAATTTAVPTDLVPATITVVSGGNQSATVGTALDDPLVVIVRNAEAQALNAIAVDWAVTAGTGTLGAASGATNGAGQTSTTFTVGNSVGSATIEASVSSDPTIKTTFTAAATAIVNASVSVQDNLFDPSSATVSVGGKVTWTWDGAVGHNITWVSGGFANAGTQSTGTHQVTFNAKGTYAYYCSIHGTPTGGMRGSVTVQ